jgi:nitroimidazol reductase NimA-like FMN-containing flavoprotein (pyridoxamine 5'-phosphate oxidase superfamily)
MDRYPETERSAVRRVPVRGTHERAVIDAILDAGLIAHVGFALGEQPFVLPMVYARRGDTLLLHGARAGRLLKQLRSGAPACVTVTLVDGLVLARSAFHHSVNYRSVVAFGAARDAAPEEKPAALAAIVDRVGAGRAAAVRPPSPKELEATAVVVFAIEEASAKRREGGPIDDPEDLAWPVWAGHVPLRTTALSPVPAADLQGEHTPPRFP